MGPMMLPTRKLDVLVVEDNVPDARFVRLAMGLVTGVAIEVTEAKRLADALEALEQRPIDVVLLDLGLPDSQGLSTFSLLHSRFRDVPVVILSGLADDTTMFDAVRLGAQDYLIKGDFDAQLLVRVMRHAIERHRLLMQLSRSLGYVKNLLQTVERGSALNGDAELVMCGWCKRLRGPAGEWEAIEDYLAAREEAQPHHETCPDCVRKLKEEASGEGLESP